MIGHDKTKVRESRERVDARGASQELPSLSKRMMGKIGIESEAESWPVARNVEKGFNG